LLWVGGDHEAALDVYSRIFVDVSLPMYPYVPPARSRWSSATTWGAEPAPAPDGEEKPAEWSEPYVSLFPPMHWYDTDLPGLDRCLAEMAADASTTEAEQAALPQRLAEARASRDKVNRLRTGDAAEREKQEGAAKAAEFRALCGSRIVAIAQLANAQPQHAEKTARDALELVPGDIALLDLLAQALARQARAEELRNGPLSSLRTLGNLYVNSSVVLDPGPAREAADRVFEGALNLYRINKVTGRAQFDHLVRTFGQRGRGRTESVQPGALGLWLYLKGEHELARVYLREGSRAQGFQSGRQMLPDAQPAELAMLALGEGKEPADDEKPDDKKEGEEGEKEDDKPVEPADDGEEPVEGINVGGFEGDAHPLLRLAPRAGALSAALYDTRGAVQRVTGVQSYYGSNYGSRALAAALPLLPRGDEALQQAVYGLPARIAQEVPAKELDAALAPDSPQTTNLKSTLTSFGDSLRSLQSNRDWQTMRAVAQRTEAVFGMIEAYALLVRARLLRDKPKDLKALSELLAKHQPAMDLRKAANATSDELYVRMDRERRDAGYPEVVNSGLLLDAAMLLADAGKPLEGARLIWHNRDVATGLNTLESIAFTASVLAASDPLLSARCRLISTAGPPQAGRQATYRDPMLRALELPYALKQLRKAGNEEDVVRYLELHVLGDLPGETMARVREVVPELEGVQPARAATINAGTMIASAVSQGGCWYVRDNWHRVLAVQDGGRTASRLAAWTLVSDLHHKPHCGRRSH
jgi:hypothetical protein